MFLYQKLSDLSTPIKDELITLDDVEIDLPKVIKEAREYQYNLVN